MENVWKEFEGHTLTHSAAHYLMTIRALLEENGYARVTDVAKRLNITRGSCSISLKALKKRGWVLEDENKFLSLSDEGRKLAEQVERNDELLEVFFKEVLGVEDDQAEIDACKIEHLLSIESSMALHNFISLFNSDHPAAIAFSEALNSSRQEVCKHDSGKCDMCQSICFVE